MPGFARNALFALLALGLSYGAGWYVGRKNAATSLPAVLTEKQTTSETIKSEVATIQSRRVLKPDGTVIESSITTLNKSEFDKQQKTEKTSSTLPRFKHSLSLGLEQPLRLHPPNLIVEYGYNVWGPLWIAGKLELPPSPSGKLQYDWHRRDAALLLRWQLSF